MSRVIPHMDELAEVLSDLEPSPIVPVEEYPAVVDREATTDIEDDYLDPQFIAKLRVNGTRSPAYRTYLRWRRTMVTRLTTRRFTQQEIADRLGVSIQTVQTDVRTIRQLYDGIATRDWAVLVEERIMQLDVDILELRRLIDTMPSLSVETEDGPMLIGPDIDQRLRIYDRIMSLENRRDKLLGIDQAAARQQVETKRMEVTVSFDQPAQFHVPTPIPVIDLEIEEAETV